MGDVYRCIIRFDIGKYYIGVDYGGKIYKILKNRYIKCKKGDDLYFYAVKEKGLIFSKLIPISDKEAGVIDTQVYDKNQEELASKKEDI